MSSRLAAEESARPAGASVLGPLALCVITAAMSWYLLIQLAALLRPLCLAVFVCYVILPFHKLLKRKIGRTPSILLMATGSAVVLYLLLLAVYGSVVQLQTDIPDLAGKVEQFVDGSRGWCAKHAPWLKGVLGDSERTQAAAASALGSAGAMLVGIVGQTLADTLVVGVFVLFLLMESSHFDDRVRRAFDPARAGTVLGVLRDINQGIAGYLLVKVQSSLLLALPVAAVLWLADVNYAVLWGAVTFVCNFIPYIGSVVAFSLPVLTAMLQLGAGGGAWAATAGVLAVHLVMTYVVEPKLTGKAVGLSPLVILISLAFWGQCWGLIGMVLAVPLMVIAKIALAHVAPAAPLVALVSDA